MCPFYCLIHANLQGWDAERWGLMHTWIYMLHSGSGFYSSFLSMQIYYMGCIVIDTPSHSILALISYWGGRGRVWIWGERWEGELGLMGYSLGLDLRIIFMHALPCWLPIIYFSIDRFLILKKIPTRRKLLSAMMIVLGLLVCLSPTMFPNLQSGGTKNMGGSSGMGRLLWPICFMAGFVSFQIIWCTLHSWTRSTLSNLLCPLALKNMLWQWICTSFKHHPTPVISAQSLQGWQCVHCWHIAKGLFESQWMCYGGSRGVWGGFQWIRSNPPFTSNSPWKPGKCGLRRSRF